MNPTSADKLPVPNMAPPSDVAELGSVANAPLTGSAERMPTKEIVGRSPLQPQTTSATTPSVSAPTASTAQPQLAPPSTAVPVAPAYSESDSDEALAHEMVVKAKSIIAQTKYDPFLQTRELGKVKAEYLKRRYGKEIKANS